MVATDALHHNTNSSVIGLLTRRYPAIPVIIFGGAAYVSLITASTIAEKNYDDQGVDRRVLSRNVEAGGTITTPMVPWTDGGVFMATTLGVSTMAYLPFLWYHMLVIAISIVYGYANIAIWRTRPKTEAQGNVDTRQNFQPS